MKKLVSILLALVLILSLSTTAFATAVTIADDDAVTRTYDGYKLLNLTVSPKTGTHPEGCDGSNHKDGCYNYAYTVNTKYEVILQGLAGDGKDIIEYLDGLVGDDETGTGTALRDIADNIYRAIKANTNITPDATNLTGSNDTIDQGYWLFADVTNLGNQEEANSLVVVDTKGLDALTITPKVGLPTIEKKVKDITDSSDASIDDNAWQDSADHDIGDTVPFKLTATLPENLAGYDTYKLVFHDKLSAGLTLNNTSIKVYMFDSKAAADADANLTDNDSITGFTTTTTGLTDGCSFEVSCEDVTAIADVTKDTVFVVYYEATLNSTADIGLPGNPNEVYLEFSNNPYTDGTGNTEKDEVIVYTYQLTINKTDADGKALKGAGFTLYKKDANGNYNAIPVGTDDDGEAVTELKGADMTTFEWKGLDDGDYKLVETTVPAGYNKMEDKLFTITADHEAGTKSLSAGDFATGVFDTGIIEQSIENKTGTVLPETGAKGTFMLITISTMFVMVATVFMVTRKKMSIYED